MDIQLIRRDFNGDFKFSFALETDSLTMNYSRLGTSELFVFSTDDYRPGEELIILPDGQTNDEGIASAISQIADVKDHLYKVVDRDINSGTIRITPPLKIDVPAGARLVKYGPRRAEIKTLSGIESVMQYVVKLLLTSNGSDIFIAGFTDDIYSILKLRPAASGEVMTRLTKYLSELQAYVKKEIPETAPDSERLESVELTRLEFDVGLNRWAMWIKVRVVDGSTGVTSI